MGLWEDELARCTAEFPKISVKQFGSDWFSRLVKVISPGTTGLTLWNTVYIDSGEFGNDRGAETLSHEAIHVGDQHRWNVLFFLSYWILPVGPSLKAIWEWRGYRENLRWIHDHPLGNDPAYNQYIQDYYCQWVASEFCGTMYLWMWPFKNVMYKKAKDFIANL